MTGLQQTKDLVLEHEDSAEVVLHISDVSREDEVQTMVRSCVDRFGRIDCAMNNAGIAKGGCKTTDTSLETYNRLTSINEKGVSGEGLLSCETQKLNGRPRGGFTAGILMRKVRD